MKSKLSSTFNKLRIIMVAALTVFCVSCDKTETTDTTGFIRKHPIKYTNNNGRIL